MKTPRATWTDAVRDAIMGRLAPPHDAGWAGTPVRECDAPAIEKKVPGLTLDRTVRLLEAALEEPMLKLPRNRIGVLPHLPKRNSQNVT